MSEVAFSKIYVPVLGAISMERMDLDRGGPTDPDLRGTDVVLTLRSGRKVTVSERFRKADYAAYNDITLRYTSLATGRKLEVIGLNAQYMLYAVANSEETDFLRWDLLYATRLLEIAEMVERAEKYRKHNKNGSSSFLCIPRPMLVALGAVAASSESRPGFKHGYGSGGSSK
ncbi:hypothetical protein [Thermanaeromonas toyohensis]|nr:hypothetical protein [Thermanaeromonas toyohensis]